MRHCIYVSIDLTMYVNWTLYQYNILWYSHLNRYINYAGKSKREIFNSTLKQYIKKN